MGPVFLFSAGLGTGTLGGVANTFTFEDGLVGGITGVPVSSSERSARR
jgi:hypothetical protein